MKIEWLFAIVTHAGSPDRAECAILGMIFGPFWPIQAIFVVEEPLCDVRIPLLSPNKFTQGHLRKLVRSSSSFQIIARALPFPGSF